jgi:signal transduction histidine kinase
MAVLFCPLPATQIAGQSFEWSIPANVGMEVALASFRFLLPESDGACRPQRAERPSSREAEFATVLARSPALLLWCLCEHELPVPLIDVSQLFDHLFRASRFVMESPQIPASGRGLRAANREAGFVAALAKYDDQGCENRPEECGLAKSLASIGSRLSGAGPENLQSELAKKRITPRFWKQLAEKAAVSGNSTVSFGQQISGFLGSQFAFRLRNEKLASLKRFVYGASHEINNPLANIATRAQTLLRGETDPERRKSLTKINQQAFRGYEMLADLMLFAHPPRFEYAPFSVEEVLGKVRDSQLEAVANKNVSLKTENKADRDWWGDATHIYEALNALVKNSLEACGNGVNGEVVISARETQNGSWLELEVRDNGPGFGEGTLEHVFDPLYSGREAGRGIGCGLAKAWRIAEQHCGEILAENLPGGGAAVRLRIPYRDFQVAESSEFGEGRTVKDQSGNRY